VNWTGNGDYALRSDCGAYFITKADQGGKWVYSAFRKGGERLGNFDSAADAKAGCATYGDLSKRGARK
jgi:hypothetical protein